MRKASITMHNKMAGFLSEDESGYTFIYEESYLNDPWTEAISLTMPKQLNPFTSKSLFPFFDGLIPEGWLVQIAERSWKINSRDRMGLLLACCEDCIGAVSVVEVKL
jgi:serine/threonine-protein kinase HipA